MVILLTICSAVVSEEVLVTIFPLLPSGLLCPISGEKETFYLLIRKNGFGVC